MPVSTPGFVQLHRESQPYLLWSPFSDYDPNSPLTDLEPRREFVRVNLLKYDNLLL